MYFQSIDDAITLHLRRTGKTQGQLAEEMGMAENTFRWKRRGERDFTLPETVRLARIVGLQSIDEAVSDYLVASGQ